MLDAAGLPLLTVSTNLWSFVRDTHPHFQVAGVASALHTVAGRFSAGLISSTASYGELVLPLASTPISDRLLGSTSFEIVHDGAAFNRLEKIRHLATWDAALEHLRVCLEDPRHDRNCGRCRKCLLTWLSFRVVGVEPRCFESPPTPDVVLRWASRFSSHPVYVAEMKAVLAEADARGIDEPWVRAAKRRLRFISVRRAVEDVAPRPVGWARSAARTAARQLRR
jgi:hypothetical protein